MVKISNHRYTLRMCKNHENLIFEWGVFFGPKNPAESIATTFRMIRALQRVIFVFFCSCLGHFEAKIMIFDVFLMFSDDFAISRALGGAERGVHGYENIEKNRNRQK